MWWIIGAIILFIIITSARTKKCTVCNVPIKRLYYTWKVEGKKHRMCPKCNTQMERRVSKQTFNKKITFKKIDSPKATNSTIKPTTLSNVKSSDTLEELGAKLIQSLDLTIKNPERKFNDISVSNITMDMYEEIEIDDVFVKKINEFNKITQKYNNLPIDNINLNFDNYLIKYDKLLNQSQLSAATTINGPVLVIAGAGSGKTRTVIYRVSFLLENNIDPESIVLLTFTRKAANEMIDRVKEILKDNSANNIYAGTFHSYSNYILRKYSGILGISSKFTIIDNGDCADIIGFIKSEVGLDKTEKLFPKKDRIVDIFSKSRNLGIPVSDVIKSFYSGLEDFIQPIEVIFKTFVDYKHAKNLYDYDDLMEKLLYFLEKNIDFRKQINKKYRYIMVDEYQDTNNVQKKIVNLLAGEDKNIMVVGDDSQSIYAFRGANYENIIRFPDVHNNCKVIKLEENYRSNQGILDFVNSINKSSKIGFKKNLFTKSKDSWLPIVNKLDTEIDEASYITDRIVEMRNNGISLDNIAILYRAAYHSNFIEAELMKRGIPYIKVGGIKFADRKHVKDVIAFLRLSVNIFDVVSWYRTLKLIPKIGDVRASRIIDQINKNNGDLKSFVSKNKDSNKLLESLFELVSGISNEEMSVSVKINKVIDYYAPILKITEDDFNQRMLDIDVIKKISEKYSDMAKFLSEFALDPPSNKYKDGLVPLIDETEDKPITLTTIHSSKGLEWYCVFVCHLLDGLFPTVRNIKNIEELEEERRLFYVACSRAKEELYLTYPSYVHSYNAYFNLPSRFLAEIKPNLFTEQ